MPVWKIPSIPQIAEELPALEQKGKGVLILRGGFTDPDLSRTFHPTVSDGLLIDSLDATPDAPYVHLKLADSPLTWAVRPAKKAHIEWVTADSEKAQAAVALPRGDWSEDLRHLQARIDQGETVTFRTEAQTRKQSVDPMLEKMGWHGLRLKRDVPCYYDEKEKKAHLYHADYILYVDHPRFSQVTAAIVEVHRGGFPPDYGIEQGKLYADVLAQNIRYILSTNGREFVQYDRTNHTLTAPQPMTLFPTFNALRTAIGKISQTDWRIDKDAFSLESYARDQKLDGDNLIMVERVAKLLLHDEAIRVRAFNFLAESIATANPIITGRWETILGNSGEFIRLNIGREVLAIFRNGVHVMLDDTKLSARQFYELGKYGVFTPSNLTAILETSIAYNFRADKMEMVLPLIQEAYNAHLKIAAESVKPATGTRSNHSAGIIDYLRKLTNRKVPHPVNS
jgi:hypothetical protein